MPTLNKVTNSTMKITAPVKRSILRRIETESHQSAQRLQKRRIAFTGDAPSQ